MSPDPHFEYSKKRTAVGRFGFLIGIIAVLAIGVALLRNVFDGSKGPVRPQQDMVMIKPAALPPTPPPTPPPETAPKTQVDEQTQVTEQDMKPAETPPEDVSTPALGTGITGNGPGDAFGLGGRDKGYIVGSGQGGGGASRFGGYFTQVVQTVTTALGRNPATRNASFNVRVRIWSDPTGRITRVKLRETTGDAALDRVVQTEALQGCQLPDLPSGMRMPLELRLNLRRPN